MTRLYKPKYEHPAEYILREGESTDSGCLCPPQTATINGYVVVSHQGKLARAHRLVWEYMNGPVPEGLEVCHDPIICNNKRCCNPDHLRVDTRSGNIHDQVAAGTHAFANKTHCPHGHEYTEENTRLYRGSRFCRECKRIHNQNRKKGKK